VYTAVYTSFFGVFCAKHRRKKSFSEPSFILILNFICKISSWGKNGVFGQKYRLFCMCILHKSFPHQGKLLFDFYNDAEYDVDADRERKFPTESEVKADD